MSGRKKLNVVPLNLLKLKSDLGKWVLSERSLLIRMGTLLLQRQLVELLEKSKGRIGDTPVIGGGTFCNEYGGVSTTGHGKLF